MQRFVACLRDEPHGFTVTVEADPLVPGAVIYRGDIAPNLPPDVRQRIVESCQAGTTALIEPLFIASIVNPGNAPFDSLVLACLHADGLVADGFRADDLPALREAASSQTRRVNPEIAGSSPGAAGVSCLVNPLRIDLAATPEASPAP